MITILPRRAKRSTHRVGPGLFGADAERSQRLLAHLHALHSLPGQTLTHHTGKMAALIRSISWKERQTMDDIYFYMQLRCYHRDRYEVEL